MLPKIIIGTILIVIVVGIFAFGIITGKGEPPPFLADLTSKQPPCPDPLVLQIPVDLTKVTAILYPGQKRGGDFKPHGGFRFDNSKTDEIEVRAPLDGKLREVQVYWEYGELQYMLDFENPCGIVYRFDHLIEFAPKFEGAFDDLEVISEEDWRSGKGTHQQRPGRWDISVKQGEVIGTAVGFRKTNNVFVDLGVYDLRGKNLYQNPRPYAVCWFNWLPEEEAKIVKSLPSGSSESGSQSTLCPD